VVPDALSDLTGGLFGGDALGLTSGGTLQAEAPHQRTLIRDHVVARLRGVALDGKRVEASRQIPVTDTELPKILVYTADEQSEKWNQGAPTVLLRVCDLVVEVAAGVLRFLDDYSDAVANVIEQVLLSDPGQGGTAADTVLVRTEKFYSQQESIDLVLLRMTFQVTYQTQHFELVPDDLTAIEAQMNFAPPDAQIDSTDVLELPAKEGP
jgi:hypothetical protein